MAVHSNVKIWVHLIWGTQYRQKYKIQAPRARVALFEQLVEQSKTLAIVIEKMNVQPEHVHMLFPLPSDRTIADIAKLFKGGSSRWIRQSGLVDSNFSWQRGYGAFSVSRGHVDRVKRYIANQDRHHARRGFWGEYEELERSRGAYVLGDDGGC